MRYAGRCAGLLLLALALAPAAAGDFVPLAQTRRVYASAEAWNFNAAPTIVSQEVLAPGFGPFVETATAQAFGNVGANAFGQGSQDSGLGPALLRASGEALARGRRGSISTVGIGIASSRFSVDFGVDSYTDATLSGELSIAATTFASAQLRLTLWRLGAGDPEIVTSVWLLTWPAASTPSIPLPLGAGSYRLEILADAQANGITPDLAGFEGRAAYDVRLQAVPAPGAALLLLLASAGMLPRRHRVRSRR